MTCTVCLVSTASSSSCKCMDCEKQHLKKKSWKYVKEGKDPDLATNYYITSLHDLLSFISGDVGGQIGLFLGASLLTMVEYLDLCAMVLFAKYKYRKK